MSPAGYWPQLDAAIDAGADSVYFGLKHFTARAKVGFTLEELPEVMRRLHARGVRGFVTFNTLVFEHEVSEAAQAIAAIASAGADALIIQDLGIAKLARQIAPGIEIHASTQMSITNAEGVAFARSFGVDRVTLARELSLDEIRAIIASGAGDVEMFVHGALCVAYSGQCFSSEAWGGRSANRGQCAQACRLPYEMMVDGHVEPLADARYLLSPGDLSAIEQIPEIVKMGVAALKIEGRYKDADYVALTTRAYRKAVDAVSLSAIEKLQLEQVYSRGLGPYFISGTNHQAVVNGRAPRHRGVWMGRVTAVEADAVVIEPADAHRVAPLKAGDGVVFDAADWRSPEEAEEGGRVYEVTSRRGGRLALQFGNGAIRFGRIRVGDLIWRTHDPDVDRAVQAMEPHRQPVSVQVVARQGFPLRTEWRLEKQSGVSVVVESAGVLGPAQNRAVSLELLREQLGRLGNTSYALGEVALEVEGSPFVPASQLNQVRRDAVDRLQALQARPPAVEVRDVALPSPVWAGPEVGSAEVHLLVRTPDQLAAAIDLHPSSITLDYLDLYGLRPSIQLVKSNDIVVRVASPRVLKPGEARILDFLLSLDCEILLRGSGMLHVLRERDHPRLIGDFSLNAANSLTADLLLDMGLDRVTPTHDLNAAQVAELARHTGAGRIEVIAYQHLPVFHTEHCVFCRFLSTGTSYKDCGRPCESHRVALKDPAGRAHPVMADVGCRNTVFGAEAQEASAHLEAWRRAGIRHFRLEFVHESADEVRFVAQAWRAALDGQINGAQLNQELKRIAPAGTTEGSLYVPSDYLVLPVL
jgi:putative protease